MFGNIRDMFKDEVPYPFYIKGRTDVIFIHIIKSAGTSIVKSLNFYPPDLSKNLYKHWHAREIENVIGTEKWQTAFKFAFVRNPWDRMISYYRFLQRESDKYPIYRNVDFKTWLFKTIGPEPDFRFEGHLGRLFKPQVYWLMDKTGEINMDFIGRFENLHDDYEQLCDHLKLAGKKLLHINDSGIRVNMKEWYDAESRMLVHEFYKTDIDYFRYSFD